MGCLINRSTASNIFARPRLFRTFRTFRARRKVSGQGSSFCVASYDIWSVDTMVFHSSSSVQFCHLQPCAAVTPYAARAVPLCAALDWHGQRSPPDEACNRFVRRCKRRKHDKKRWRCVGRLPRRANQLSRIL